LDLPGIIEGAKDGKGRGRQVIAGITAYFYSHNISFFHLLQKTVARTCSLILMVLDVTKPLKHKELLEYELEGFGIRLNKTPPNITFKRKDKGGLNLNPVVCLDI
jgi:ribosome-interacting GTPase 1